MATRAEGLGAGAPPMARPRRETADAAALRASRELRPGLVLAFVYAWGLAMARLIDVSEDGKAMLLFGTTFSVVLVVSAVARPRWYLPLVVAYLPFSRVYALPVAGITGANLTNLILLLGAVAWISSRVQGRRGVPLGAGDVLVVAFVAVSSLGLMPASSAGVGLGELAQTYRAWLAPILFFFLARGLVRDRTDVSGLLHVLAWTVFLVAADTWKEGLDRATRGSIDRARVPGLMAQPNSMGAFLAYYGAPMLALAIAARPWRKRLAYLAAFLFAVRATLFTFSRGSYLAMAAGSATVLAFGNPLLLVAAGGGGAMAVGFVPSLVPDSVRERFSDTTSDRSIYSGDGTAPALDKSSAHRLVLWRGAVRMIAANPLVGVGLGRFQQVIGLYTDVPLKKTDPHDAHNAFLLQAAEMGAPSLALLLVLFLVWGATALRVRFKHRHPVDRRLSLVFLGSLAAVLVSCMLGSRFSDDALIGGFWLLAGMVVVVGRLGRRRRRRAAA